MTIGDCLKAAGSGQLLRPLFLVVLLQWGIAAGSDAQQVANGIAAPGVVPQKAAGPTMSSGQISGTVIDADGAVVSDAEVTLSREGAAEFGTTKSDSAGRFRFLGVPAGKFKVSVAAVGLTGASFPVVLHAGEIFETPSLRLGTATVDASVDVVATQQELAQAEVKVEEHQRLAGVLPNFFVTYDWHAAPLSPKQKFELSSRSVIDPANFAVIAATAGVQQANNSLSGYGRGPAGYGKRFGADLGDVLIGTALGGAVFPSLFHQDPRYFYKGTGSVWSRTLYALSMSVVARGDNGKWEPGYAGIAGDFAAGGLSNLYYPSSDRRGAALTLENGLLDIASDAVSNVVQELVFRHLTPHAPSYTPLAHP